MGKVTSKLQVTLPKHLADQYGIRPGDALEWEANGETLRVLPFARAQQPVDRSERLRTFDAATRRQAHRQNKRPRSQRPVKRGWKREDLYGARGAR